MFLPKRLWLLSFTLCLVASRITENLKVCHENFTYKLLFFSYAIQILQKRIRTTCEKMYLKMNLSSEFKVRTLRKKSQKSDFTSFVSQKSPNFYLFFKHSFLLYSQNSDFFSYNSVFIFIILTLNSELNRFFFFSHLALILFRTISSNLMPNSSRQLQPRWQLLIYTLKVILQNGMVFCLQMLLQQCNEYKGPHLSGPSQDFQVFSKNMVIYQHRNLNADPD